MAVANHPELTSGAATPRIHLDTATDTLFIRSGGRPTVAQHVKQEIWLMRDAETDAITGAFIENFEAVFLKRNPELLNAWTEARSPLHRWSRSMREGFNRAILGWLRREHAEISQALLPT